MSLNVPGSLKEEHEELHAELARAVKEPGKLGKAAENVARILDPHFEKEDEFALPPLGLLSMLAEGKPILRMEDVLSMTERLKTDLPQMLKEHQAIVTALTKLTDAANHAEKPEYAFFAKKLTLHAKNEEEVIYPAAILTGEY